MTHLSLHINIWFPFQTMLRVFHGFLEFSDTPMLMRDTHEMIYWRVYLFACTWSWGTMHALVHLSLPIKSIPTTLSRRYVSWASNHGLGSYITWPRFNMSSCGMLNSKRSIIVASIDSRLVTWNCFFCEKKEADIQKRPNKMMFPFKTNQPGIGWA